MMSCCVGDVFEVLNEYDAAADGDSDDLEGMDDVDGELDDVDAAAEQEPAQHQQQQQQQQQHGGE
jgi:hypothetical protein